MIKHIKEIAEEVLYRMDKYSDDALVLILRTGMAESRYKALKQMGDGPAIGFFQVEPNTAIDVLRNYVHYRPKYHKVLDSLGFDFENVEFSLLSNIAVQVAFCRLQYLRHPKPIPSWDNVEAQAKYWKKAYNTELGKGTIEHFVEANKELDGHFKNNII